MQENPNIPEEEDYNPTIITLVDEENNEHQFEMVDQIEHNEETYVAVVPYYEDPAKELEEEPVLIIFRVGEPDEEGLETFDIVDDDEEYYEISGIFATRLQDIFDIEE
ncbi:MAG: DUF1292 domain-containing protein [Oscillospiraceae bacterium]